MKFYALSAILVALVVSSSAVHAMDDKRSAGSREEKCISGIIDPNSALCTFQKKTNKARILQPQKINKIRR